MSDIVERLESFAPYASCNPDLLQEAAAELTRLRTELDKAQAAGEHLIGADEEVSRLRTELAEVREVLGHACADRNIAKRELAGVREYAKAYENMQNCHPDNECHDDCWDACQAAHAKMIGTLAKMAAGKAGEVNNG